jgi:predicted nucleotide-binding protein (sugar kinase/HSP70/actin superfamily)
MLVVGTVIGIPRALFYYTYIPLFKTFFENLNLTVILSGETNKEILDAGVKETVNDACIPIKLYHGHVLDLKDRVDYLFIPRMVSADGRSTFCPKFLGLPDMVRFSGASLPSIIDSRFQRSIAAGGLLGFFINAARRVGVRNVLAVVRAVAKALQQQRLFEKILQAGRDPETALACLEQPGVLKTDTANKNIFTRDPDTLLVALLGYPYAIYDHFVSAGLYRKLQNMKVRLITPEQIPRHVMRKASKQLSQSFFWYYSNRVGWSGLHILENKVFIDGIIHVTAFGCGPDAMVDKFLELEAKRAGVPFMTLSIDEHTAEGGILTRLEAFIDMLWVKRSNF